MRERKSAVTEGRASANPPFDRATDDIGRSFGNLAGPNKALR